MKWNWQCEAWPHFIWDKAVLDDFEAKFLHKAGMLHGALKFLAQQDKELLIVELISAEAIKTSEIEGEFLNRESMQSSIKKNFGLITGGKRISPAEQGISEMMVDLYHTFSEPLTHDKLFSWHDMLTKGRRDLSDVGCYRTHEDAMLVVSGSIHKPNIHFEAPPSDQMSHEMDQFVDWFNETMPCQKETLPPLTRAGIGHLYFVCIHPFEDGNGRIARGISGKILSQSLGEPILLALSQTIQSAKKAYYQNLELNNKELDITKWLEYFAQTILDAQEYSLQLIGFLIAKTRFFDRLKGQFNERQEKAISRMFREGLEGFKGGLSAENYINITKTSRATATRDLHGLVDMGALRRTGERRYTRYTLNLDNMDWQTL